MSFGPTHRNPADLIAPGLWNCPSHRHPDTLDAVIDQFDVERNPRYAIRDTSGDGEADTFCNIFAWDVTRALCAELPHWWRGRELSANGLYDWLLTTGSHFGWTQGRPVDALMAANAGRPAVAAWKNPTGSGHIAVVRPTQTPMHPMQLAQAGRRNLARASLEHCFGSRAAEARFFVHE